MTECPLQWGRGLSAAETADRSQQDSDGTASMGPRPFGRGDVWYTYLCSPVGRLQWGRGLSAAETCRDARLEQPPLASMGPRPFGRGDEMSLAASCMSPRLQWGRGLSAAETLSVPIEGRSCAGFNGAAAFRPRRRSQDYVEASLLSLQWGRGLSAAETAGLASCVVITTYARVCEREGHVRQVFGHVRNPAVHNSLFVKDLPSRERAQDPPPPPSRSRGYSPENTAKTPRPQWRPAPNAMGPAASSLKISLAQRSGHLRR